MGDMEIPDELIDQLLGEYQGPEQLTGPDGLINQLRRRLIERAAGAELEQHLGYPPGADAPEGQHWRAELAAGRFPIDIENEKAGGALRLSTTSRRCCLIGQQRRVRISPRTTTYQSRAIRAAPALTPFSNTLASLREQQDVGRVDHLQLLRTRQHDVDTTKIDRRSSRRSSAAAAKIAGTANLVVALILMSASFRRFLFSRTIGA